MANLFQVGDFTLHSGEKTKWLIDCSALSRDEMEAVAIMIMETIRPKFYRVIGVPRGGLRLADALTRFTNDYAETILIVDDVLTTGNSMEVMRNQLVAPTEGIVIFARGKCPNWITPLFRMCE